MSTKKDKFTQKDRFYMNLALNLARDRSGLTGENPSVGCVIVKNDEILSTGQTGINGRPHAEYAAIRDDAPGKGITFFLFFNKDLINLDPGSDMVGVPASETRAKDLLSISVIMLSIFFSSLCSLRLISLFFISKWFSS